jgi:hypothetical protein
MEPKVDNNNNAFILLRTEQTKALAISFHKHSFFYSAIIILEKKLE